jgi:hypothetical protein
MPHNLTSEETQRLRPEASNSPQVAFLELSSLHAALEIAPLFRKVAPISWSDIVVVPAGEERIVETWLNGQLETTKKAKAGDYILTGVLGEQFVSSAKSFHAIHTWDEPSQAFLPQHRVRAVFLPLAAIVRASWGEDMHMSAGAVAAFRLNDQRFYGNQADSFTLSYVRAHEDGSTICPMTLPLDEQLEIVRQAGATRHLADIESRLRANAKSSAQMACR